MGFVANLGQEYFFIMNDVFLPENTALKKKKKITLLIINR